MKTTIEISLSEECQGISTSVLGARLATFGTVAISCRCHNGEGEGDGKVSDVVYMGADGEVLRGVVPAPLQRYIERMFALEVLLQFDDGILPGGVSDLIWHLPAAFRLNCRVDQVEMRLESGNGRSLALVDRPKAGHNSQKP